MQARTGVFGCSSWLCFSAAAASCSVRSAPLSSNDSLGNSAARLPTQSRRSGGTERLSEVESPRMALRACTTKWRMLAGGADTVRTNETSASHESWSSTPSRCLTVTATSAGTADRTAAASCCTSAASFMRHAP
eukprot:5461659-Prymnesium_polylepis.2